MKKIVLNRCGEVDKTASFQVNELSWEADFSYLPSVNIKCCYDEKYLYVKFFIAEYHVKATHLIDLSPTHNDSCVEVFIQLPGSEFYYNFEVNPIGTMLAKKLKSRTEFELLSSEVMASIIRIGSFARHSVNIHDSLWEMELRIPFSTFGVVPQPGMTFLGNFYKCGDDTDIPHFVSWNRIDTPTPDFHRPEFFAEIVLN